MRDNALVVMAKAPIPGAVKTRMTPPLSAHQAADLSRALLLDLLDHLRTLDGVGRFVAFDPAGAAPLFEKIVPGGFVSFPQQGDHLGERMRRALERVLGQGNRSVVLIGSDFPVFPIRWLEDALSWLNGSDDCVVIGPSRDGGYYLIGMSRLVEELFNDIPWSSESVLAATLEKLERLGIQPRLAPQWFDFDTIADLRDLQAHIRHCGTRLQPRTARFLNDLAARGNPILESSTSAGPEQTKPRRSQ